MNKSVAMVTPLVVGTVMWGIVSCGEKKPVAESEAVPSYEVQEENEGMEVPVVLLEGVQKTFKGFVYSEEKQNFVRTDVIDSGEGFGVIEGDIIVGESESLLTAGGQKLAQYKGVELWPKGIVPYELSENLVRPQAVRSAINHIDNTTKINFRPKVAGDKNWIRYASFNKNNDNAKGVGGQSPQGLKRGGQTIYLNAHEDLWNSGRVHVGTVIHETLHSLGVGHEHCRKDRGDYIVIVKANIQSGLISQFDQSSMGKSYGAYDYNSIMHYHSTAFGIVDPNKKARVTIKRKSGTGRVGGGKSLTWKDKKGLNEMYAAEIAKR